MAEPRTQADIVADFLARQTFANSEPEPIQFMGIAQLHKLPEENAVEQLVTVLKSRPIITYFEWSLTSPDGTEKQRDTERKVKFTGLAGLVNKPRREIALVLFSVFHSTSDVVGLGWDPSLDYITLWSGAPSEDDISSVSVTTTSPDQLLP